MTATLSSMRLCTVAACDRPYASNGFCQGHHSWWRKHDKQTPTHVLEPRSKGGVPCVVEGCDRGTGTKGAKGMCSMHYRRTIYGEKDLSAPAWRGSPREKNPKWAGNEVGYGALHERVRRWRGSASAHSCVCGEPATNWAYDHADPNEKHQPIKGYLLPYSTDVDHYFPACGPCHKSFDLAHSKGETAS